MIGSYHFVFEDEKCVIPEDGRRSLKALPEEYSHLYLALKDSLQLSSALRIRCVRKQQRCKAAAECGISKKIVMMTGDSERTAKAIAQGRCG